VKDAEMKKKEAKAAADIKSERQVQTIDKMFASTKPDKKYAAGSQEQ
jgi:hypothetical protein